jgi:hypothetical protein
MASDGKRVTRAAADPLNLRNPCLKNRSEKELLFTEGIPEKWNKIPAAVKKQAKAF